MCVCVCVCACVHGVLCVCRHTFHSHLLMFPNISCEGAQMHQQLCTHHVDMSTDNVFLCFVLCSPLASCQWIVFFTLFAITSHLGSSLLPPPSPPPPSLPPPSQSPIWVRFIVKASSHTNHISTLSSAYSSITCCAANHI